MHKNNLARLFLFFEVIFCLARLFLKNRLRRFLGKALVWNPREMIRGRISREMIRVSARKSELQDESRSYGPKVRVIGPDVMQSGFGVNFLFWSGEF